jgi:CRP-like cAMP-binding protein
MDEPGDKLYVIEKGQVRISHSNKEGKEIVLNTLGENAFWRIIIAGWRSSYC